MAMGYVFMRMFCLMQATTCQAENQAVQDKVKLTSKAPSECKFVSSLSSISGVCYDSHQMYAIAIEKPRMFLKMVDTVLIIHWIVQFAAKEKSFSPKLDDGGTGGPGRGWRWFFVLGIADAFRFC